MKSILEVVTAVNKELRYGQLIHQPVIAWAFDMSRAQVQPEPVAVGGPARFLENGASAAFQLVPANPGFFQMYYVIRRLPQLLERLTAEQRAEIRQTAGSYYLGLWRPEDSDDWREAALRYEQDIFEEVGTAYPPVPENAA